MSVNILTRQLIAARIEAAGFVGKVNIDPLTAYFDLLAKWNKKTNLTALSVDPPSDEAIDRLIVEPVLASQHFQDREISIVDLGSGGGSPALPLAIQLQGASLRLVESRSRKCSFLREAIRTVDLKQAVVEESRFELMEARPELKGCANALTVRAVRIDADLVNLIRFLLVPNGIVYRFASLTESSVPEPMHVESQFELVRSLSSILQVISIKG